jgi:hypothetical protein
MYTAGSKQREKMNRLGVSQRLIGPGEARDRSGESGFCF